MTHDEAVEFIVGGRGTHFDPAVVDAFVEVASVSSASPARNACALGQSLPNKP